MRRQRRVVSYSLAAVLTALASVAVAVPAYAAPSATLTVSAAPDDPASFVAGAELVVTFSIENTGDSPFAQLDINTVRTSGTGALSPATCTGVPLAVGQIATCTAIYEVTRADVDAGGIVSIFTATATVNPGESLVTNEAELDLDSIRDPAIALTKTVAPATGTVAPGDVLTYSFAALNTGTVTLTDLAIAETDFSGTGTLSTITCPATDFAPDETVTCTATYTLTAEDIAAGSISNSATASAYEPDALTPVTSSSTVARPLTPAVTPPVTPSTPPATPGPETVGLAESGAEAGGPLIVATALLVGGAVALLGCRRTSAGRRS